MICIVTTAFSACTLAENKNPYSKRYTDNSYITLTGEVTQQIGQQFMLDYGNGIITVEFDDWDSFNEAQYINPGEKVTVYGDIDQDLFERRKIEASRVYVHEIKTFYDASSADEEWTPVTTVSYIEFYDPYLADGTRVSLTGNVKSINDDEFILDTGIKDIQVDTDLMSYNPLDKKGIQQIKTGDKVKVMGKLDKNLFERNEIQANSIITLKTNNK